MASGKGTNFIPDAPISKIKGISEAREKLLNNLGIFSCNDFLHMYPRKYEDRTNIKRICDLHQGINAVVTGRIVTFSINRPRKNLSIISIKISDGTGFLDITIFNKPYLYQKLKCGASYSFFGEVSNGFRGLCMNNPITEEAFLSASKGFGGIVPVYSLTNGLTQNVLRKIVKEYLASLPPVEDTLSQEILGKYNLCSLDFAIRNMHFPKDFQAQAAARKRLAFDELLVFCLALSCLRSNIDNKKQSGISFPAEKFTEKMISLLPFELSDSQKSVWNEICNDMENPVVMNRLVLGDVGSGKTVIAELAMLKAISAGYQALFMAPTEILAAQHAQNIDKIFSKLGIKTVLLAGSMKASEKRQALEAISSGEAQCIVGTHALIQKNVEYKNVGIVITDEQHRFGVHQREALALNGKNPDILIMSATPIPRTLALSLYGDMDVSKITALPKGRLPVKTYSVDDTKRDRVYTWARNLVAEGVQVYIVHPLIESSEEIDEDGETISSAASNLLSAEENFKIASSKYFSGIKTALIHGKMSSKEKDDIMKDFSSGNTKILFSTTVIEVGVDVANACLIIIENADRFGLAQLHQLRGRVGRSSKQAYCVLFSENKSNLVKERLNIMCSSNDGLEIAEKDLALRGPGDFFGTSQHGLPALCVANLYEDMDLMEQAKNAVNEILLSDSQTIKSEYLRLCNKLNNTY